MGDVQTVFAKAATALVDIETEDTAVVVLKFRSGALGVIEATTATRPADLEGSISMLGERGTVEIGGFAVNEMKVWRFEDSRTTRGAVEVLGQSAQRLRLRPPGLLRARRRLHPQRTAAPRGRPRGPAQPRADLRDLRVDRDRPRGAAAIRAPLCRLGQKGLRDDSRSGVRPGDARSVRRPRRAVPGAQRGVRRRAGVGHREQRLHRRRARQGVRATPTRDAYGVRHCISCGNGTDAIYIVLRMLGIGPGDEVITTAASWISTSETISQAGATPVFVDVDDYYLIDVDLVERAITPRTRAVIPVHLYGQAARWTAIREALRTTRGLQPHRGLRAGALRRMARRPRRHLRRRRHVQLLSRQEPRRLRRRRRDRHERRGTGAQVPHVR